MEFNKYLLWFGNKDIRMLYDKHDIDKSRKDLVWFGLICILTGVLHMGWSIFSDHHLQSIISKAAFLVF